MESCHNNPDHGCTSENCKWENRLRMHQERHARCIAENAEEWVMDRAFRGWKRALREWNLAHGVMLTPQQEKRRNTCERSAHTITRSEALRIIDELRFSLAMRDSDRWTAEQMATHVSDVLFDDDRIHRLNPCTGEAHQNAHADQCGICRLRWGWTGLPVRIV